LEASQCPPDCDLTLETWLSLNKPSLRAVKIDRKGSQNSSLENHELNKVFDPRILEGGYEDKPYTVYGSKITWRRKTL